MSFRKATSNKKYSDAYKFHPKETSFYPAHSKPPNVHPSIKLEAALAFISSGFG